MGKSKGTIINWPEYNKDFVNRGLAALWSNGSAQEAWHSTERHGGRGRSDQFNDVSIEIVLMLKGVFNLSLRSLEGFVNSVFELMEAPLRSPTYSCFSKRAKMVEVNYCKKSRGPIAHIAIDSMGLKVFGEDEPKARTHGLTSAELSGNCIWH